MFRPVALLFAILAAFFVGSHASALAPSQTPSCYTCPNADGAGFPLGVSDTTSNPIFCSYPAVDGEDPHDFFCTYDKINGGLVEDEDVGLCPGIAMSSICATRRRRHNALPRAPSPSTSNPRSPKPDVMQTRRKLGAMKRHEN